MIIGTFKSEKGWTVQCDDDCIVSQEEQERIKNNILPSYMPAIYMAKAQKAKNKGETA